MLIPLIKKTKQKADKWQLWIKCAISHSLINRANLLRYLTRYLIEKQHENEILSKRCMHFRSCTFGNYL